LSSEDSNNTIFLNLKNIIMSKECINDGVVVFDCTKEITCGLKNKTFLNYSLTKALITSQSSMAAPTRPTSDITAERSAPSLRVTIIRPVRVASALLTCLRAGAGAAKTTLTKRARVAKLVAKCMSLDDERVFFEERAL
jgi:hypothetical protein